MIAAGRSDYAGRRIIRAGQVVKVDQATAYLEGAKRRVIFVHALRNSLIPLATGLGHVFSVILAGSFLIERVFNIDGMGYLGYTSILQRDYPVALGIIVIGSMLMLLGNILSDVIYAVVDPRIRFK